MASSIVAILTLFFIGTCLAQDKNETAIICETVEKLLGDDGFDAIETKENEESRKKRSLFGGYAGGLAGPACGPVPSAHVNFVGCFNPGRAFVQDNTIVHNYYRTGSYSNCLNYFRALPLANVYPVNNGFVGHITHSSRTYTVNACNGCFGGNPGISVRCNSAPYNYLQRNFVFNPAVATSVNQHVAYNSYNNYNAGGCVGSWC